jgi:outer membrane protein assembly factor BamB
MSECMRQRRAVATAIILVILTSCGRASTTPSESSPTRAAPAASATAPDPSPAPPTAPAGPLAAPSTLAAPTPLTTTAPALPATLVSAAPTARAVPTTPAVALAAGDWPTYHRDATRAGVVAGALNPQRLTEAWRQSLDGAVYAEPLVVNGRVVVATEANSLYALDARTGQIQWRTNIGEPVRAGDLPCGNIDPLGITGTPVYDPRTKLIFAVAEVSGPAHVLVGVDLQTGAVKVRRSADPPGAEPVAHQQRAALALAASLVYIAYGGLYGDCGNYHGWIVAAPTEGGGSLRAFQVPTTREGGIWAPSGPAIDVAGKLYVSVGNGEATSGSWDQSDSVLRLSPTLQLEDSFAPATWPRDNAADADLGSLGPVLAPGGWVFAAGKSGQGYLLHADALGGVGGQVWEGRVCRAFGGAAVSGTSVFVPCTDGLRQVQIDPSGQLTLGWQAPPQVSGSPIVGGQTVYSLDLQGTLYALDSGSGAVRVSIPVGATSRFATPTLVGDQLFVGTLTGIVAVTIA